MGNCTKGNKEPLKALSPELRRLDGERMKAGKLVRRLLQESSEMGCGPQLRRNGPEAWGRRGEVTD